TLFFHVGVYAVVLELLKPLFRGDLTGMPFLTSTSAQSYVLNDLAIAYDDTGRLEEGLAFHVKKLQLDLEEESRTGLALALGNLRTSFVDLDRRAEGVVALSLARELAEVAGDVNGVTMAIHLRMHDAVTQGRFADAEALEAEFRQRPQPHVTRYRPGGAEF